MRALLVPILVLSISAHAADGFAPKKIELSTGKISSLYPVLSLPYDGPKNEKPLRVVEGTTVKEFPATVHDGQVIFVPEGGMPNTKHTYTLKESDHGPTYQPIVNIKKHGGDAQLDVFIEDQLVTSYHYPADGKKPFLYPINSAGGFPLSRDYPMDPNGTPKDHPHHKSCWVAYGDINGVDCWGEEPNSGFQTSGEVTSGSGDAFGWIHAKNVWQDKDHKPLIDEEREYRFYGVPETARMFDVTVTFTANYGDVKFGDTKEGGIVSVRMRPEMCMANAIITNSEGDVGEPTLWGKPAAWCDYTGKLGGAQGDRGIAIFDTPTNLRYPTSWHVRAYGLMGANCFGWKEFGKQAYNKGKFPAETGDYSIKKGDKLNFKYRVYIHSGNVKDAAVADRFTDYATPPQVKWLD